MTDTRPMTSARQLPFLVSLAVVAAIVIAFLSFASVYADVLWYDHLDFLNVLTTQWIAMGILFVIGFISFAVPIWLAIELAYRSRPVYTKLTAELDRYQSMIEPLRKLVTIGIPAVFGVMAGTAAASNWQSVLLWLNSSPSGTTDPQFGLDTSFYLFELPFYNDLVSFVSTVIIIAAVLTALTGYLYGAIRFSGKDFVVAKGLRIQLAVLGLLYLLTQAANFWLNQYNTLTTSSSGLIVGASYSDVNAYIPGLTILAGIAVLVALSFVVTAVTGKWRIPIIGAALLIVSSLVIGQGYPWVIQKFQVDPNERSFEAAYIDRNIKATREAFGINNVQKVPYDATTDAEAGALREDAETAANIRIIDPALISNTFRQEEQNKQYYQFSEYLSVDRYTIDGETKDTVIALRELNLDGIGDGQSWNNTAAIYTHGYGVVAAYGNRVTSDGLPEFLESGIPSTGVLGDYEPRIYFGQHSPSYSIVGAPEGATPVELDYPTDENDDSQAASTTFSGDGGPKLDNILNRVVYALKFQTEKILLSELVNDESQILYDRDPSLRVSKVAPYLTLDSEPYPAIVDGKIVWIIDAYTTSANYPYSTVENMQAAIVDTHTRATSGMVPVNYIRNSVKATVDAYDGKVTLYAWDEQDPILQTWQKIFPENVKPISEMSAELMSHVRYPSDLFKLQRKVLGTYHVTNVDSFYSRFDAWVTPNEPTAASANTAPLQPPYYLTLQLPDEEQPSFSIYSTYIPDSQGSQSRNVLTGFLSVNADAGNVAGQKSEQYGTIKLLTLPKDNTVNGPGQMQSIFNTNTEVANQLSLIEQGGRTKVVRGNLLTLPVGGGLLYVQPVYVQSTGETSYPLLRKVLVGFGNSIAFEDTLDQALDKLFQGDSGIDIDGPTGPTDPTEPVDPTDPNAPEPGPISAALKKALDDANAAIKERQAALAAGDWAAYGVADAKLQSALERAIAASK